MCSSDLLRMRVGAVLPGAREILEDLAGRPDVTSVLLTGNTEAGARVKLRHFGLDRYFAAGAFADETTDRIASARKGWELVTRLLGTPPTRDRSFVIGDCAYRSIVITQIGPSRSPGSVDRDHRDRHRDHVDRSIAITPRRARAGASSPGRMAGG